MPATLGTELLGELVLGEETTDSTAYRLRALLLYQNRDVPLFAGLANVIDERGTVLYLAEKAIADAFDLATANGDQLDAIGSWLGRDRQGMGDDRYRRALSVVSLLLLSSTGTRQNLLDVWEAWTTYAPLHYRTIPPAEVEIGGPCDLGDASVLAEFLRLAAPAGVVISGVVYESDYLLGDCAASALADTGITDCAASAVTGAALLGWSV